MQLAERIHLVGSSSLGFDLSDPFDPHVYVVDGGSEAALIDLGAGMRARTIIENVRCVGIDPGRVKHLLCTHAHGDHVGGAARMRALLPNVALGISREVAELVRSDDEVGTSIDVAKVAGIHPLDYRLEPCPVESELEEGDSVLVGDLVLECIRTPGTRADISRSCSTTTGGGASSAATPCSMAARSCSRAFTTAPSRT